MRSIPGEFGKLEPILLDNHASLKFMNSSSFASINSLGKNLIQKGLTEAFPRDRGCISTSVLLPLSIPDMSYILELVRC